MDHDADVIRVIEGRCGAIERRIIEVPFRRGDFPDELCKIVSVCVVAGPAAFCRKVILVPPCIFNLWRQRLFAPGLEIGNQTRKCLLFLKKQISRYCSTFEYNIRYYL